MLWPSELGGLWMGGNSGGVERIFFGGGFGHPTSYYYVTFETAEWLTI